MRSLAAAVGVCLALWPWAGTSAVAGERRVVEYEIDAVLDPATHTLTGRQTVRWRNTTSVPTSEIWLHLYLNAFASSESTFMRELAADAPGWIDVEDRDWGWTRITRFALGDGTDLLDGTSFERPDDGNVEDHTVVRAELPRAVQPGSAETFELEFEARLPRVIARTGYADDFYFVGQWFPKLGVFEGESGWNCHQFHAAGEFFADFGSYRVRLTVPRGWVVGATGELVSRSPVGTDDVLEFHAYDVHDFAWTTAHPGLMAVVEADFDPGRDVPPVWLDRARETLGVGAVELELPPAAIRLIVPRSQEVLIPRMLRAARLSVAWFGLHLGPYPQPQLTVVSPPPGAAAAGGMEYPTLITTGAKLHDAYPPFAWRAAVESVTAHEFAHQYFQGLLASNETEAGWLDEGLASWAEDRFLADMLDDGLAPELRPLRIPERLWLTFERQAEIIDQPAWAFRGLSGYFLSSYTKTAVALRTLEGVLGEGRMVRAVRSYVERYRFEHPTGRDFQAELERVTGDDLGWFFDAVIRGAATPDWAVLSVRHDAIEAPEGMTWDGRSWVERDDAAAGAEQTGDPESWRIEVEIGRLGDLVGPVEVELVFTDGRVERRWWDSRDRWVRWSLESGCRLEQVTVDPDGVWRLETRRADNYWRDGVAGSNPLWWLGPVLRLAGQATLPWS